MLWRSSGLETFAAGLASHSPRILAGFWQAEILHGMTASLPSSRCINAAWEAFEAAACVHRYA